MGKDFPTVAGDMDKNSIVSAEYVKESFLKTEYDIEFVIFCNNYFFTGNTLTYTLRFSLRFVSFFFF